MRAYDQRDEQRYYDRAEWGVMHPYQREVLADLLAILPDDARTILDVGCGDGMITDRLPADRYVVGCDLSTVALAGLKRPGAVASAFALPFADRSFDLVMANDVVEHFAPEHRAGVLAEMERVADRAVVVTVPFAERLANGTQYTPRGTVHRNRHQDSFDVATVRGFLSAFELKVCIFSGAVWEDELAPVERLKALRATLLSSFAAEPDRPELEARLDRDIARLRRRQAEFLGRHPDRVDSLRRRTELIALYARRGRVFALPARLDTLGAVDLAAALRSAERHDLLSVSGSVFEELRSDHLPIASLWPCVVFSGETRSTPSGVELTGGADPASLKVGFPVKVDGGARFEASLMLEDAAQATLSYYGGAAGYRQLLTVPLERGSSLLRSEPLSLEPSEFGYAFEIVVAAHRFTFNGCRIDQPRRPERLSVASGPRYLSRTVDGVLLLTSLATAPRRALPTWFASSETLAASPANPYFANLDAVTLALDELRLHPEDERPHGRPRTTGGSVRERARALAVAAVPDPLKPLGRRVLQTLRTARRGLRRPLPAPAALRVARRPGAELPSAVTMLVPDDRIDRRVLLQARSLARHGVKVTVVAAPYPEPADGDAAQFPELTIVRVDTGRAMPRSVDLSRTTLRRHRLDWREVYFYHDHFLQEALRHPAEIVVAHDLPVLPAALAAAELGGAGLFYDAHELYPEQEHFGPERMALYRRAEAALIGSAAVVTTVNRSIADEMARRYGIAPPRLILNAPAAGGEVPVPRTRHLREALNLADDRTIVLFQGSLSLNRNLEPLVESFASVADPSAVLVVMGPGAEKRRELEGIARARGLFGTRVFFHDAVPQSELLRVTASADIGIIPYPGIDLNTTFCTPNKLFEFMAAGLPILANDLPELQRFVADGGVGIVHPMTSAAAIAEGVDRMLAADLPAFRAALREVAPRMTWQAQEPALLDIYRDFMRGTGQTAG